MENLNMVKDIEIQQYLELDSIDKLDSSQNFV